MRNPLRLTPKPAHLLIPLIAIPLLAACDTGGQLPYEDASADQGASTYENTPVAEPDPAFNTSPLSQKTAAKATSASRPATVPARSPAASSAPAGTVAASTGAASTVAAPADTTAAASTGSPAMAAGTVTQPAKNTTDQYLLTPGSTDSSSAGAINYQQSGSTTAPVVAIFDDKDPHLIDVTVRDAAPVSKAYLADPRRQQYAAGAVDHKTVAYDPESAADSDIGVHVMTDPSTLLSGAGVSIPIVPSGSTAGGTLIESHFSFTIPDRAVYDGSWQHWVIHIDLDDGVNKRSMELLPPKPANAG